MPDLVQAARVASEFVHLVVRIAGRYSMIIQAPELLGVRASACTNSVEARRSWAGLTKGVQAMEIIVLVLALTGLVLLALLPRLRKPAKPLELGLGIRRRF